MDTLFRILVIICVGLGVAISINNGTLIAQTPEEIIRNRDVEIGLMASAFHVTFDQENLFINKIDVALLRAWDAMIKRASGYVEVNTKTHAALKNMFKKNLDTSAQLISLLNYFYGRSGSDREKGNAVVSRVAEFKRISPVLKLELDTLKKNSAYASDNQAAAIRELLIIFMFNLDLVIDKLLADFAIYQKANK